MFQRLGENIFSVPHDFDVHAYEGSVYEHHNIDFMREKYASHF